MLSISNFERGYYRFTEDLLALEAASPPRLNLPYEGRLASPLQPLAWERALQSLPDRTLANFLMRGITGGFRIGIGEEDHLRSAKRNLKSAEDNPQVISTYLAREVRLNRLAQLPAERAHLAHISPCGAIPKKNRPDKWHLIVDLSAPQGHSINHAISKGLSSVAYANLNHAVTMLQSLGKGCLLAKLDLKEAYRAVPIHPSNQRLLAIQWEGATYIDRPLPFSLRSAPKLFSALTDTMMWFLNKRGVETALHYLDDFLILGSPGSTACQEALDITLALCGELGFPIAPEKTEGPSSSLVFLGIEIDTERQILCLPDDKKDKGVEGNSPVDGSVSTTGVRKETGSAFPDRITKPCCHSRSTRQGLSSEPV